MYNFITDFTIDQKMYVEIQNYSILNVLITWQQKSEHLQEFKNLIFEILKRLFDYICNYASPILT